MTRNWYNGNQVLDRLSIRSDGLYSIRANAFNETALRKLAVLKIHVANEICEIVDGAFNALDSLKKLLIISKGLDLVRGVFDPIASTIHEIYVQPWPGNVNLNEMFGNEKYRLLNVLHIHAVDQLYKKFSLLAAANFTSFTRLRELTLIDCSIQVIDRHAFDVVARTLRLIDLNGNCIKTLNVEMFRIFLEIQLGGILIMHWAEDYPESTCDLVALDVFIMPFVIDDTTMYFEYKNPEGFLSASCGLYRNFSPLKFNSDVDPSWIMRFIDIRMAHKDDSILMVTNFTSKMRMLFVNFDTLASTTCHERRSGIDFLCLNVNNSIERLNLSDIDMMRSIELISVTIIPLVSRFGARPMHSMTVKRNIVYECNMFPVLFGAILLGIAVGFCTVIGVQLIRGIVSILQAATLNANATDDTAPYEYSIPMQELQHTHARNWRN